jgi:hypothetical protein
MSDYGSASTSQLKEEAYKRRRRWSYQQVSSSDASKSAGSISNLEYRVGISLEASAKILPGEINLFWDHARDEE